MHMGKH